VRRMPRFNRAPDNNGSQHETRTASNPSATLRFLLLWPLRHTAPDFKQPPAGARGPCTAPADGPPEDFFSTSNLPTYVHLGGGRWLMPTRPRMDWA
jgi:hypothetical protein